MIYDPSNSSIPKYSSKTFQNNLKKNVPIRSHYKDILIDGQILPIATSYVQTNRPGRLRLKKLFHDGPGLSSCLIPNWLVEGLVEVGGVRHSLSVSFHLPWNGLRRSVQQSADTLHVHDFVHTRRPSWEWYDIRFGLSVWFDVCWWHDGGVEVEPKREFTWLASIHSDNIRVLVGSAKGSAL